MYAGKPAISATQSTAKSCIQALLKTREQHQLQSPSRKYPLRNITHFSGGFAIESKALELPVKNSFEDIHPQEFFSPEDVDNQNDFNYSQKLFHIADGNLYSIFTPIQGRSYGMKPSFLRKQKYTVQECRSRGRKNLRKGLKFHNFLPSESVTSEKGNGVLQSKWKVHSECRLREEHGTKQITISNWSQSIQNSSDDPLQQNSVANCSLQSQSSANQDSFSNEPVILNSNHKVKIKDGQISCNDDLHNSDRLSNLRDGEDKEQNFLKPFNSKKGSLKFVLNSLLDKPIVTENNICDLPVAHTKSSLSQKHRRKPVQTRRVVPYTKYLSIIEEDESSPLDLSSKYSSEKSHFLNSEQSSLILRQNLTNCDNITSFTDTNKVSKSDSTLNFSSNSKLKLTAGNSDILTNSSSLAHLLQNQMPSPLVLLTSPVLNTLNKPAFSETNSKVSHGTEILNSKQNFNMNTNQIKNSYPTLHTNPGPSFSGNMQYAVHKSFIKNSQPKSRRRSQRSVIKKNLEDTFRQNGFLVKTKQVSDGEATFCKFRQLRKYTRYYLKSWQQHLPDEVNKMWKGFLPPKTVLPQVSEAPENINGPQ